MTMKTILLNIKDIFCRLNGSLTIENKGIPKDIRDSYGDIQKLEYDNHTSDKHNLISDFKNITKDLNKAKSSI